MLSKMHKGIIRDQAFIIMVFRFCLLSMHEGPFHFLFHSLSPPFPILSLDLIFIKHDKKLQILFHYDPQCIQRCIERELLEVRENYTAYI